MFLYNEKRLAQERLKEFFSSWPLFSFFFGVVFRVVFLFVLGSFWGAMLGHFWRQNRIKMRTFFGSFFVLFFCSFLVGFGCHCGTFLEAKSGQNALCLGFLFRVVFGSLFWSFWGAFLELFLVPKSCQHATMRFSDFHCFSLCFSMFFVS